MYASVTSLYLNGNHTQRQRQKRLDTRLKKLVDKKQMLFYIFCFAVVVFVIFFIVAVVQVSF